MIPTTKIAMYSLRVHPVQHAPGLVRRHASTQGFIMHAQIGAITQTMAWITIAFRAKHGNHRMIIIFMRRHDFLMSIRISAGDVWEGAKICIYELFSRESKKYKRKASPLG